MTKSKQKGKGRDFLLLPLFQIEMKDKRRRFLLHTEYYYYYYNCNNTIYFITQEWICTYLKVYCQLLLLLFL